MRKEKWVNFYPDPAFDQMRHQFDRDRDMFFDHPGVRHHWGGGGGGGGGSRLQDDDDDDFFMVRCQIYRYLSLISFIHQTLAAVFV